MTNHVTVENVTFENAIRARGQTYTIDFTLNTQTNTKTPPYKVRPIRHPGVAAAGGGENAYPGGGFNHGRRSSTGSVDRYRTWLFVMHKVQLIPDPVFFNQIFS